MGYIKMKSTTKGTINEKRAIIFFLKKECIVCKNVEQHGPYDITVTHPNGETELLDIKTHLKRKRDGYAMHRNLKPKQKKLGVKLFYIDENMEGHYHPPKGKYTVEKNIDKIDTPQKIWAEGYKNWKSSRV